MKKSDQIRIPRETTPIKEGDALPTIRYVVLDEHTLGYIHIPLDEAKESVGALMGVLHSSILKGGHHQRGAVSPFGRTLRLATREDFADFRVQVPPDFVPPYEGETPSCQTEDGTECDATPGANPY